MPGRIGDSGVGLIRPEIDIDACIDKHPDRLRVPTACNDMQGGQTLAFDQRVDALVEHRGQHAGVARIRRLEPYSGIDSIGLVHRAVAGRR